MTIVSSLQSNRESRSLDINISSNTKVSNVSENYASGLIKRGYALMNHGELFGNLFRIASIILSLLSLMTRHICVCSAGSRVKDKYA